jgi:hypothetical protein
LLLPFFLLQEKDIPLFASVSMTMLPTIFVIIGFWKILQLRVYMALEKYFSIKQLLIEKTHSLEVLTQRDKATLGINPIELSDITDTLDLLSKAYRYIRQPIQLLYSGKKWFSPDIK